MKGALKKRVWYSIMISMLFAIFGMILVANPSKTLRGIAYILGILFILQGTIIIVNAISNKQKLYNNDPINGIIAIIFGVITIIFCKELSAIFRILIAIWIIYTSLLRMNISFNLKKIDIRLCIYSFIIAIAMLATGIIILLNKNVILVTIGLLVMTYSILDIIESLILISNINKIEKNIK